MKCEVKCLYCNKIFYISESRVKYGRGKTCCKEHQYALIRSKPKKIKVLICNGCKRPFTRYYSQINRKNGKGKFCSTNCAYANKKRGNKASNWRGGKVSKNKAIRKSSEYLILVKTVLERDKYKCRICLSKINLHVHHLFTFATYPALRLVTSNCVTVCQICHSSIHRRWVGKK